jgi:hypothetical protein
MDTCQVRLQEALPVLRCVRIGARLDAGATPPSSEPLPLQLDYWLVGGTGPASSSSGGGGGGGGGGTQQSSGAAGVGAGGVGGSAIDDDSKKANLTASRDGDATQQSALPSSSAKDVKEKRDDAALSNTSTSSKSRTRHDEQRELKSLQFVALLRLSSAAVALGADPPAHTALALVAQTRKKGGQHAVSRHVHV